MFKDVETIPNFPALERRILEIWDEEKTFERRRAANRGNPVYSFFDGPITANNPMGVHHAWGRTYKDLFQRYQAMLGKDQRYQNGFDCQGLWLEVEVEKDLGFDSKQDILEFGLDRFAEKCKERVRKFSQRQTEQSIRLGQWMDWPHSYYTYSDANIETIWLFLARCKEKGWLYRGKVSLPWCWRCGTPLAHHELLQAYDELTHRAVYFKLPVVGRPGVHFLVWTTTPWTLAANTALAVHPELPYARVRQGGETLILSEGTLSCLRGDYEVEGTVQGKELIGLGYEGPIHIEARSGAECRVIGWKEVGEAEGTGIVHIAPGCGKEDYDLAKEHGLKVLEPIDDRGRYTGEFAPFTGRHALEVPEEIFAHLDEHGHLYKVEDYTHRYPHCWRCKEELVFRLAEVYFIRADEIRQPMIEAARTVRWIPEYAGKRMEDWLHNMGDWCISRFRFWGLPLPAYICECGHETIVSSRARLKELASTWVDVPELHRPWIDEVKIACPACGARDVERVPDVGDCWLDAGIIPFSTLGYTSNDRRGWEKWFPAEFISEMIEQVRLWFYSLLFMSVTLEGRAPYRTVMCYESMVDEHSEPFSKTKGNAIWFDHAAEKMGADVMRWLYVGQRLTANLRFGYGPAEVVRKKILTLWNCYGFFVRYASADRPRLDGALAPPAERSLLDRWILARLQDLTRTLRGALDGYDPPAITTAAEKFVDDLSNWYIRRSRRRFWKSREEGGADKAAAYATLHHVLVTICRLLAPVIPFLTDEMYRNLASPLEGAAPSVHLTDYPEVDAALADDQLVGEMEMVLTLARLGHAARENARIKVRQPLARIRIAGSDRTAAVVEKFGDLLADELNVKTVESVDDLEGTFSWEVKPNFKALGPRLGKKVQAVARALAEADGGALHQAMQAGGEIFVEVGGEEVVLGKKEVDFHRRALGDVSVVEEGELKVGVDTMLTPELVAEGNARDFVRQVQEMRKESGLQMTDRIRLTVAAGALAGALAAHRAYIAAEVLATEVVFVDRPAGGTEMRISGQVVRAWLEIVR